MHVIAAKAVALKEACPGFQAVPAAGPCKCTGAGRGFIDEGITSCRAARTPT